MPVMASYLSETRNIPLNNHGNKKKKSSIIPSMYDNKNNANKLNTVYYASTKCDIKNNN